MGTWSQPGIMWSLVLGLRDPKLFPPGVLTDTKKNPRWVGSGRLFLHISGLPQVWGSGEERALEV